MEIPSQEQSSAIQLFLAYIKDLPEYKNIRFIILFGSVADGTCEKDSDIDIALSCSLSEVSAERLRMHILGRVPEIFDIHIFEHLPLYIKIHVLKGEVLDVQDEDALYDIAYQTIRDYELFKPHFLDYIGERAL